MFTIILTAVLPAYFLIISFKLREYRAEERTLKATKPLSKIISLSPLAGIVIFAVLFAFVLKGRFAERATHAFLVFALWLYAARFYQYILSYYKKKAIIAASVIGMGFSVALAVLLTPLDRYVGLIYSYMNWCSVFLGCLLYIVFYFAAFAAAKKKRA